MYLAWLSAMGTRCELEYHAYIPRSRETNNRFLFKLPVAFLTGTARSSERPFVTDMLCGAQLCLLKSTSTLSRTLQLLYCK